MLNKNIETFLGCDADYAGAQIVLFGAPFDSTTSFRPGTRFGPAAIRRESYGLELYSPYQDKELTDRAVLDAGDIELPFGDPAPALAAIEERAAAILADGKVPFLLGGEHLVTLGCVRAVARKFRGLHILHFDAHADLRDDYLGAKLSHACVLRRCHELVGDGKIFQFGIRSGDKSEFVWGREHVFTHKFDLNGLETALARLRGKPVYLTVDLDVLDPSVFPGTGTPEPGGVTFDALRAALTEACNALHIVAADVNELSPHYDPTGASTAVACKIVRELLIGIRPLG
ncbi:MAG TPA: agmatinase [Candidatus Borkfalkia faecigallinarum]|uniref:Agmatinase n=1 Tax=Candidatus Borkfalkia faecigallinarum TaxID=2838509 RepID=A0A9D1VUE2_9FIRM|nr:agmatinase [Candidatus Borkfalkia faecigallinarum]